jgi:cytochrome bd-type quinol oxidase subunit 1
VQGLLKTINANSPSVTQTDIWISLITFVVIYIALGSADLVLMLRYGRRDLDQQDGPGAEAGTAAPAAPALTY